MLALAIAVLRLCPGTHPRNRPDRGRHRPDPEGTTVSVAIAEGKHPVPSRTRKLSPPAPMVLPGRLGGRVGRCRNILQNGPPARAARSRCPRTLGADMPKALSPRPGGKSRRPPSAPDEPVEGRGRGTPARHEADRGARRDVASLPRRGAARARRLRCGRGGGDEGQAAVSPVVVGAGGARARPLRAGPMAGVPHRDEGLPSDGGACRPEPHHRGLSARARAAGRGGPAGGGGAAREGLRTRPRRRP